MLAPASILTPAHNRPSASHQSLTSSQKDSVQGILSQYDAKSLTQKDAKAINDAFSAQGIRPSADLKNTIEAAGFDPKALRAANGPPKGAGKPPPPPPPPRSKDTQKEDVITKLLSALKDYQDQVLNETDILSIQNKMQEAGYAPRNNYLDLSV